MSGNIGNNQNNIKITLANGKTFDLKKLDKLVGQSSAGSIFAKYDSVAEGGNGNNKFDTNEVNQIKQKLIEYQKSDNSVSDDEINDLINTKGHATKNNTNDLSKTFEALSEEVKNSNENSSKEKNNIDKTLTNYTVQPGDTPEVIAKKLGYEGAEAKQYAQQLKQHFKENGFTNAKGWLMVGQKITLLGDHNETLANSAEYTEDKEILQARYANTEHAKKATTSKEKEKIVLPASVQARIDDIKKYGGVCRAIKNSDGSFSIIQTSGKGYFQNIKADNIELKYDANGKFVSQKNTYKTGEVQLGTYKDGKMNWTKTRLPSAEIGKYLLMSEQQLPENIVNQIAILRSEGVEVTPVETKDGYKLEINENTISYRLKTNQFSLINILGGRELVYDKQGNLISEKKEGQKENPKLARPKFTPTFSTTNKNSVANNASKKTSASKPGEVAKPETPQKPRTVDDLYPIERGFYQTPEEVKLPKNIQDQIINLRLQDKEVGQVYELLDEFSNVIGYQYELRDKDDNNFMTSFINRNNYELKTVDINGNEMQTPVSTTRRNKVASNQLGKNVGNATPNHKMLENGRVTTDNVPAYMEIGFKATKPKTGEHHLSDNEDALAYANSLSDNKAALMTRLGITNEQYNNLAELAMGIAEQETHFGEAWYTTTDGSNTDFQKRTVAKQMLDAVHYADYFGSDLVEDTVYGIGGLISDNVAEYEKKFTDGTKSYGMTQAKIDQFMKEPAIAEQLREFGITCGEDIRKDPEKQAIATMIILNNKRIVAESAAWQARLDANNANISDPKEKITKNDLMALLWNGNSKKLNALKEGNLTISNASYARNVRQYVKHYFEAEEGKMTQARADQLGAVSQGNNGQLGSVIFMANRYNSNVTNNANDIKILTNALNKNSISQESKTALLNAVKSGEIAFGYGLTETEASSLTQKDVDLLLEKYNQLKNKTQNLINPTLIREAAAEVQNEFKAEYLGSREFVLKNEDLSSGTILHALGSSENASERLSGKNNIVGLKALTEGKSRTYERSVANDASKVRSGQYVGFATEADKGVNPYDANGNYIPNSYRLFAEAASDVANAMGTGGRCATGFKTAIVTAGVDSKENIVYPNNVNYIVQEGEDFLDVAKKHGLNGNAAIEFAQNLKTRLASQTKIDQDGNLIVGKTITLKDSSGKTVRHTVKNGETLESIVRQYGHSGDKAQEYADLLFDNLLTEVVVDQNGNLIQGKKITVHQKGTPIGVAKDLYKYFNANPEKFEEVKYLDLGNGTSRELNATDIKKLPAGYIVVYIPGAGFEEQAGHVVVTNGNGQGYADEVDNLRWDDFKTDGAGNGKGEHGTYKIYRLKAE